MVLRIRAGHLVGWAPLLAGVLGFWLTGAAAGGAEPAASDLELDAESGSFTARTLAAPAEPQVFLAAAYAPGGKTFAVAGEQRVVQIRDALSGRTIQRLAGHDDVVTTLAYSPDGATLASAGYDRTVRLWDAATGKPRRTLEGHTDWVLCAAFSADGKTLATGDHKGHIKLWDVTSGTPSADLHGARGAVRAVAFTPDGKTLATGGGPFEDRPDSYGEIRLWHVDPRLVELATWRGHTRSILSLAFSPDGRTLTSGSVDRCVKAWDVASRNARYTVGDNPGWVGALAVSPDGALLALAGSDDGLIRIVNAANGVELARLRGHRSTVRGLAFAPDGRTLASGSIDRTVKLWPIAQLRAPGQSGR